MFAYLRYFAAISLVVIIVAGVAVGFYFRRVAADDVKMLAERSSVSLAQGFINTAWKTHRESLDKLANLSPGAWKDSPEFQAFSEDAFRYFEEMPVIKLNLYTARGYRVLSTDQSEILFFGAKESESRLLSLESEDEDPKLGFARAQNGETYSRIIRDSTFSNPDGSRVRGSLVQTFVPIISDSYVPVIAGTTTKPVEAVIEVFYDITPQWQQLYKFQIVGTFGVIVIFLMLLAALFFTSRRAESIIAKQHETNVDLAAAAARAEAASREKSQFLANISHELRTPLNAIIGFSEIIKDEMMGPLGNQQYRDYIRDIHGSGVHLLSLINDILDYSKAEAGKLTLEIAEADVSKIIKSCLRLVMPRAEAAQVTLVEVVPKDHIVLHTDAKKLKQVLLNLLSNAVKFTPANGKVTVTAWQQLTDDSYAIEVKDTGIGIAPKDISKAMSPFGQVDSELSRRYEGTGLGLPLTKKFVELMGGKFHIESEVNVGTTITFTLPRNLPAHPQARAHEGHE